MQTRQGGNEPQGNSSSVGFAPHPSAPGAGGGAPPTKR
jgi:hypothetical protein